MDCYFAGDYVNIFALCHPKVQHKNSRRNFLMSSCNEFSINRTKYGLPFSNSYYASASWNVYKSVLRIQEFLLNYLLFSFLEGGDKLLHITAGGFTEIVS